MHKMRLWPGLRPGPRWESLQCSLGPPSWILGENEWGKKGGGKKKEECEGRGWCDLMALRGMGAPELG